MIRFFAILALLAALSACETLTETECVQGDWRGIGVADGAQGRAPDFIGSHIKACADLGITPDRAAWEAGRSDGLKQYCTPQNAYVLGRRGRILANVCPAVQQAELTAPNRHGLRYHQLTREIDESERDWRDAGARLATLTATDTTERAQLLSRMASLRLRITSLRSQQLRYASWP